MIARLVDPDIVFRSPLLSSPVQRIAANGDFVAAELVGTGTSTGPAIIPGREPIPPGGRPVEFGMAGFFRLTPEGLVAEERYY